MPLKGCYLTKLYFLVILTHNIPIFRGVIVYIHSVRHLHWFPVIWSIILTLHRSPSCWLDPCFTPTVHLTRFPLNANNVVVRLEVPTSELWLRKNDLISKFNPTAFFFVFFFRTLDAFHDSHRSSAEFLRVTRIYFQHVLLIFGSFYPCHHCFGWNGTPCRRQHMAADF